MNKQLITKITFALLIVFFIACDSGQSRKISSSGKTAEMIVVINDVHWESDVGQAIRKCFRSEIEGLATIEPHFDLVHMPKTSFGSLFEKHRNVFIVEINKQLTEAKLEVSRDVWSQPQIVARLMAPTKQGLIEAFEARKNNLFKIYLENERTRIIKAFNKDANLKVTPILKSKYNIIMAVPNAYYVGKTKNNFIWLRKKTRKFDHEVIVYSYPYTDTIAFNPQHIIAYRNEITQKFIPGQADSSYMIVSEAMPTISKVVEINGCYAVETRGLWEVEGDFMGGPFLNYTILDEKNNRIVTVDGSAYSPNEEKRSHIRQFEGMFYSVEFIRKTEIGN